MVCKYSVRKMDVFGKGPLFGEEIENGTFEASSINEGFNKSREIIERCMDMVTISTDKVKGWFEMSEIANHAEFWTIEKIIYREVR